MTQKSRFVSLLKEKEVLVLDGGFATTLEQLGHTMDSKLWSANATVRSPLCVVDAHERFIQAGSDVIISSSYQMSYQGFREKGYSDSQTDDYLRRATACALAACNNMSHINHALVAASVGCYGAHLADGSEYSGLYGLSVAELTAWHSRKFNVLANSGAAAIACETIPAVDECIALRNVVATQVELMQDGPAYEPLAGWMSFSCKSGSLLNSGEPFENAIRALCDPSAVQDSYELSHWGIGVNCTDPEHVCELLDALCDSGVSGGMRPIVVYPNKGEAWNAVRREWERESGVGDIEFAQTAVQWLEAGATVIGGCCRTTPATISLVAEALHCHT